MAELKLTGSAIVCCVHGRTKRAVLSAPSILRNKFERQCICCENAFSSKSSEPNQFCTICSPKIIGGVDRLG